MTQTVVNTTHITEAQPIRLNLGCSNILMDGYINVDLFSENPDVLKMDIRKLGLHDDYADEIYSSHSLEHLPFPETIPVLREWFRVLKPGGIIKLNLPDLEWCTRKWLSSPESERWGYCHSTIFGLQNEAGQVHYTGFTHERIKSLLHAVGFAEITTRPVEYVGQQCIWAEAVKKAGRPIRSDLPADSPVVATSVRYFQTDPIPGTDYNIVVTQMMLNDTLRSKQELVDAFKQLECERDLYKSRWEKLLKLPLVKVVLWFRDLFRK